MRGMAGSNPNSDVWPHGKQGGSPLPPQPKHVANPKAAVIKAHGGTVPKITEKVYTGGVVTAKKPKRVGPVDPRREYITGGPAYWVFSFMRSLPHYIDDVTRDFGDDLYERMMQDPKVSQCLEAVRFDALSQGLSLTPAVSKGEPGYDKAVQIRDFCQRVLDSMETPLIESVLDPLTDAIAFGNQIAEKVWHVPTSGPLAGYLALKAIKHKPRRTYAFVVDAYNNIQGVLGRLPDVPSPLLVDSAIADPTLPNFLPRSKFVIASFRPRGGDPRGRSLLRPAYTPWWLKQQGYPGYLKYMAQWASPSLVGTTAETAAPEQEIDEAGNPIYNAEGEPSLIEPSTVMAAQLAAFQAGSYIVLPYGADVKPMDVSGEGAPFAMFNQWCDSQIELAITLQALATSEGQHMARAAAEVHQDTLGFAVQVVKGTFERLMEREILLDIVRYNFGEKFLHLTPKASLSETEQHDFVEESKAVDALWKDGYLDVSQLPDLDARLGLPERSEQDLEMRQGVAVAKAQQEINAATAPPPLPGGGAPGVGGAPSGPSGAPGGGGAPPTGPAPYTGPSLGNMGAYQPQAPNGEEPDDAATILAALQEEGITPEQLAQIFGPKAPASFFALAAKRGQGKLLAQRLALFTKLGLSGPSAQALATFALGEPGEGHYINLNGHSTMVPHVASPTPMHTGPAPMHSGPAPMAPAPMATAPGSLAHAVETHHAGPAPMHTGPAPMVPAPVHDPATHLAGAGGPVSATPASLPSPTTAAHAAPGAGGAPIAALHPSGTLNEAHLDHAKTIMGPHLSPDATQMLTTMAHEGTLKDPKELMHTLAIAHAINEHHKTLPGTNPNAKISPFTLQAAANVKDIPTVLNAAKASSDPASTAHIFPRSLAKKLAPLLEGKLTNEPAPGHTTHDTTQMMPAAPTSTPSPAPSGSGAPSASSGAPSGSGAASTLPPTTAKDEHHQQLLASGWKHQGNGKYTKPSASGSGLDEIDHHPGTGASAGIWSTKTSSGTESNGTNLDLALHEMGHPAGGITDPEHQKLKDAGWKPEGLGVYSKTPENGSGKHVITKNAGSWSTLGASGSGIDSGAHSDLKSAMDVFGGDKGKDASSAPEGAPAEHQQLLDAGFKHEDKSTSVNTMHKYTSPIGAEHWYLPDVAGAPWHSYKAGGDMAGVKNATLKDSLAYTGESLPASTPDATEDDKSAEAPLGHDAIHQKLLDAGWEHAETPGVHSYHKREPDGSWSLLTLSKSSKNKGEEKWTAIGPNGTATNTALEDALDAVGESDLIKPADASPAGSTVPAEIKADHDQLTGDGWTHTTIETASGDLMHQYAKGQLAKGGSLITYDPGVPANEQWWGAKNGYSAGHATLAEALAAVAPAGSGPSAAPLDKAPEEHQKLLDAGWKHEALEIGGEPFHQYVGPSGGVLGYDPESKSWDATSNTYGDQEFSSLGDALEHLHAPLPSSGDSSTPAGGGSPIPYLSKSDWDTLKEAGYEWDGDAEDPLFSSEDGSITIGVVPNASGGLNWGTGSTITGHHISAGNVNQALDHADVLAQEHADDDSDLYDSEEHDWYGDSDEEEPTEEEGNAVTAEESPNAGLVAYLEGKKLPASNTNATTHNNKLDKMIELVKEDNLDGLKALKFGTNTYGKKQALYAQRAIGKLEAKLEAASAEEDEKQFEAAKGSLVDYLTSKKLDASNTNAGTTNKKLDAMIALVNAGDVDGLKAMTFGTNTYGKKLQKAAQRVIGTLEATKPGGTTPAVTITVPAPATSSDAKAWVAHSGHKLADYGDTWLGGAGADVKDGYDFAAIPDAPITDTPWPATSLPKSTGLILVNPDGKIWLHAPKGAYGGYKFSFAKGQLEAGLTEQQNAHKELWEEQGLTGNVVGALPPVVKSTSVAKYFVGYVTGGHPNLFGDETSAVHLVTPDQAKAMLAMNANAHDLKVLDHLAKWLDNNGNPAEGKPAPEFGAPNLPELAPIPNDATPATAAATSEGIAPSTSMAPAISPGEGATTPLVTKEALEAIFTEAPEGAPYVTVWGHKIGLNEASWSDADKESHKAAVLALVSNAAKKYLEEAITKDYVNSGGSLAEYLAVAQAASQVHNKTYFSGYGLNAALSFPNIQALKEAAKKGVVGPNNTKAADVLAKLAPTNVVTAAEVLEKATYPELTHKFVKNLGGSNGAKLYETAQGFKHVVKKLSSSQAYTEVLAGKVYKAIGADVPESRVVEHGGNTYFVGEWKEGTHAGLKPSKAFAEEFLNHVVAHAFLGNWDVLGLSGDNTLVGPTGKPIYIDNGGAMIHKATGALKAAEHIGPEINEIRNFANPAMNSAIAGYLKKAGHNTIGEIPGVAGQIGKILSIGKTDAAWKNFVKNSIPDAPTALQNKLAKYLAARVPTLQKVYEKLLGPVMAVIGKSKLFANTTEAGTWLHENGGKVLAAKATAAQSKAMKWWQGTSVSGAQSYSTATSVGLGDAGWDGFLPATKKLMKDLQALADKPEASFKEQVMIARRISPNAKWTKYYEELPPGHEFNLLTPQSCSYFGGVDSTADEWEFGSTVSTGYGHGSWKLIIHVSPGVGILDMDEFKNIGEKEMLVAPNGRYRFLEIKKKGSNTVMHLELVGYDPLPED